MIRGEAWLNDLVKSARREVAGGKAMGFYQAIATLADQRDAAREALKPFAAAWDTVTDNESVVRTCSMSQIGRLCGCEVSGVHFKAAAAVLNQTTGTPSCP